MGNAPWLALWAAVWKRARQATTFHEEQPQLCPCNLPNRSLLPALHSLHVPDRGVRPGGVHDRHLPAGHQPHQGPVKRWPVRQPGAAGCFELYASKLCNPAIALAATAAEPTSSCATESAACAAPIFPQCNPSTFSSRPCSSVALAPCIFSLYPAPVTAPTQQPRWVPAATAAVISAGASVAQGPLAPKLRSAAALAYNWSTPRHWVPEQSIVEFGWAHASRWLWLTGRGVWRACNAPPVVPEPCIVC